MARSLLRPATSSYSWTSGIPGLTSPAERYNLSHQLISADWEQGAQLDLPLVHENSLRQFSIDATDAPAGTYRLMAILYDSRSRERFDWIENQGDPPYMQVLAEVAIPE